MRFKYISLQNFSSTTIGFQMLKVAAGSIGFFGQGAPASIMTDNCDALRNALRTVWPTSKLYLCHFHILQQVCGFAHHCLKPTMNLIMISLFLLILYSSTCFLRYLISRFYKFTIASISSVLLWDFIDMYLWFSTKLCCFRVWNVHRRAGLWLILFIFSHMNTSCVIIFTWNK